ncbi:MAG: hypothetical protein ACOYNL_04120 [Rickettsiales bacterium]
MRWLIRMLIFWAISAPLFYLFGLPYLLELLSKKAQTQGHSQCIEQITKEGIIGKPDSPISPDRGETYCHCVSDGLTLGKNDVLDMVRKKPPTLLTATAQAQATKCTKELEDEMRARAQPSIPAQPAPTPAADAPEINF